MHPLHAPSLFTCLVALVPLSVRELSAQEPTPPTTKKTTDRLDLDLLLEWENVSNPRLSRDGSQIVYTRQWTNQVEDKMQSELWIMQSDGSRQRFLTKGSGAEWSPDS